MNGPTKHGYATLRLDNTGRTELTDADHIVLADRHIFKTVSS